MADNRISLQKLEIFCRVVELGGVRKAAEGLYVSQPVVSAHLRSLQDRVGATLFRRDGRGIALTEAGQQVYVWATEVLRGRQELEMELKNLSSGLTGSVSIGASISVGNAILTPALIAFRKENPGVAIRLDVSPVEIALEATSAGRHDFTIVATDAALDSRAFSARLIHRPPWVLIASGANAVFPVEVTVKELSTLPFVCPPSGMAIRRSQDAALASIGVPDRRVEIELGSAEATKQAVIADLGVALLWRPSVQAELDAGLLREVTIVPGPLLDKLFLVQRKDKRLSPLQRQVRAALLSALDELFGEPAEAPPS